MTFRWDRLPAFKPSKAPKTKWLWRGFIPERAITLIIGASGSFKSTFLLALSNAVCNGEDFLGRHVRRRRTLYVDNENAPDVLANRHREMKLNLEGNQRFRLCSIYDAEPVAKIDSEEFQAFVKQSYAETGKPLLIILDHWSTFLKPGDSGLETGETTPLFLALKRLCAVGATIVVLMHTLKSDPTTFYGCKDVTDKADLHHLFVASENQINVSSDLKRYGPKSKFRLRPIVNQRKSGNSYIAGFRIAQDWEVEAMKGLIRKNPKANQRQLAELGKRPLKMGRNKVIAFIKQHTGKHWKAIAGLRKKQTYVVMGEK